VTEDSSGAGVAQTDGFRDRLAITLDNMMEGYTLLSHELQYLYVNKAGARHARLRPDELIGRTPMDLFPGFQRTGMFTLLQRCSKERSAAHVEEELTLVDGSTAYFEMNVQPTSEGLVILSLDITERRRTAQERESLEDQLRQSQKMDAVGRLAGGIAHDFNNMLAVILGYGEELLQDLRPEDPMHADVSEIHKAAQRAAELTRQLLMFSRQQVLEPRVLDLNEVLGGMKRMLGRVLGENLELVAVLEPALGRILADQGNIEQIIMNLAINAKDAMTNGGRLTIETENVLLDDAFCRAHLGMTPGPHVLLAVTDTGRGMAKATRLRIFEPFFTTKEPGSGTGLGLSTVFGIVQRSGGGIWVYSEPGCGTTFKVYLPRNDQPLDVKHAARVSTNPRGMETVLLVEDDGAVRAVAQRMLERSGYRVLVAEGPDAALRQRELHGPHIDLLLTDVVMPRMSGAELATRLAPSCPEMKVLFMSGYTDITIGAHGVLDSGASFLQKPFSSRQLSQKVRSTLEAGGSPEGLAVNPA
jgi:two-component system cell cycle sensor histidine kinase/response regulator CckA